MADRTRALDQARDPARPVPAARLRAVLAALVAVVVGILLPAAPAAASGEGAMKGQTVLPPDMGAVPAVDLSAVPATASQRKDGPDGKPHQVHARLLADVDAVRPGDTFRLGVHLTQDPGWHTYWHSPGSVGKPTEITWQGPDGVTFGDYAYPAPAWFEMSGIVSYGYDDQVLLFSEVTLPEDLPLGEASFGADADASWLVCEVQCIPGDAQLSLTLPVVARDAPVEASQFAPLFDFYADLHPVPAETVKAFAVTAAIDRSAVKAGEEFKAALLFTPTGQGTVEVVADHGAYPFFSPITSPGWMSMGEPVMTRLDDGSIRVEVPGMAIESADGFPGSERVGGLFQVKVDGEWVRTEVVTAVPFAPDDAETTASNHPLFDGAALAAVASGDRPGDPTGNADGGDEGGDAAAASSTGMPPEAPAASFAGMLGLAFLGGVLLNIMPCVLPVLTLKLYSLVEQADIDNAERRRAGMAYTAGIVVSFVVLAVAVVLLKGVFDFNVGWGFQFQYPGYVIALGTIVFIFALNLFGVFEIPTPGANAMNEASDKEGLLGYFMTGAFATLLATPCSAPFLGTGMGFAFTLPAWGIVLFFAVAGLGLAFPFLLIAFVPALFRYLPRPGAWMETFKQFLGFTLVATTIWLADVVASQTGREGATGFLIFLAAVALGAWIFGRFGGVTATGRKQVAVLAVAVALVAFTGRSVLKTTLAVPEDCDVPTEIDTASLDFSEDIPWQDFSEERVAALAGQPVFIDFTADWCLTCKVNEKNILDTKRVRTAMAEHGIVPLKADWTNRDDTITAWLQRYGKAGVPFYLVIPADPTKAPIPLPEVITPDLVTSKLAEAAG